MPKGFEEDVDGWLGVLPKDPPNNEVDGVELEVEELPKVNDADGVVVDDALIDDNDGADVEEPNENAGALDSLDSDGNENGLEVLEEPNAELVSLNPVEFEATEEVEAVSLEVDVVEGAGSLNPPNPANAGGGAGMAAGLLVEGTGGVGVDGGCDEVPVPLVFEASSNSVCVFDR
jgi:hypothetical protein